jgi:2-C-methyl-D-erythritol 4-phosphate cytidylyltransferase
MGSDAPASVSAVIAAAGSGERLGAGGPKAFVPLGGRPMLEWSIEAFRAAGVARILVAVPPGHDYEPAAIEPHGADPAQAPAEVRVLAGGATRSASVANAMEAVETELVAIHDAARPLLTPALIASVVGALVADPDAGAAIAAAPIADTVKRGRPATRSALASDNAVNARFVVEETLDRTELWGAQTPQGFRVDALRAALAGAGPAAVTDEAMLIEAAGGRVLIEPVEDNNPKVTTPLDLRLAEQLLAARA